MGFLKTSWFGKEADGSRATSAAPACPNHPTSPAAADCEFVGGRVQRFTRSCQRGVVLSDGESWGAGRGMVFQHPSASIGFQDGIQVRMPSYLVQWHQSSLEPCQSRKADRSAARQQATPRPACPGYLAFRQWVSYLRNQVWLFGWLRLGSGVRGQGSEVGGWRLEVGGWRLEVGGRRSKTKTPKH